MIQLLVIDLSCLVEGFGDITTQALSLAAEAVGVRPKKEDIRGVLGLEPFDALSKLCRDHRARRATQIFETAFARHFEQKLVIHEITGASATLGALRREGVKVAVVTSLSRDLAAPIFARLDLPCDVTVTSCETIAQRPRPGLVFEAMRRLGVFDPEDVVKVGETPVDLAEGAIAGCGAVVGATYGSFRREELYLRPHTHLVDRISKVADVVFVAGLATAAIRIHDQSSEATP